MLTHLVCNCDKAPVALLLIALPLCVSCDANNDHVAVPQSEIKLSTRLASEVSNPKSPYHLATARSSYTFVSEAAKQTEVEYLGTDCGCTGAFFGDVKLNPKDVLLLTPKQSMCVTLQYQIAALERNYVQKAFFRIRQRNGFAAVHELVSRINVLDDVVVEPKALIHDFPSDRAVLVEKKADLRYRFRNSEIETLRVEARRLPAGVRLLSSERLKSAELVDSDGINEAHFILSFSLDGTRLGTAPKINDPILLTVWLDEKQSLDVTMPCYLRVKGSIDYPRELYFGVLNRGQSVSQRLLIESVDNDPFRIKGFNCRDQELDVHVQYESDSSRQQWVSVSLTPKVSGDLSSTISIVTDRPSYNELPIGISARVK